VGRGGSGALKLLKVKVVTGCREPSFPVDKTIQLGVDVLALKLGEKVCCTSSFLVENYLSVVN